VRFRSGLPSDGRCELIDVRAARAVLPALHAASARQAATLVARDAAYWSVMIDRLERGESLDVLDVGGGQPAPWFCLYRNGSDEPEGLAVYRIVPQWQRGLSRTALHLLYFVPASATAHAAMWRFLLSLALVERVHYEHGPVDEALTWLLVDG